MTVDLTPLYTLTGSAVVEKLGKVQDGERIKIEFRGKSAGGSPVEGKAHGTTWILIGPLGPGETNAVQDILLPSGDRLVVELRGYTMMPKSDEMEIRACGIIRTSAASLAHLNGRLALVVQKLTGEALEVQAYYF